MEFPRVKPRTPSPSEAGVYASLDELVRLQYKARGFTFLPRQPVHSILAGRHASRLRGRGLNFEEIRGYLPGDDIRNIDWKVTARYQKPHVRVYTEEKDRPALLLVDQRMSMFFGSRRAMKSVTAAECAALSAWRILDAGDRVGALVFSDDEIVEIQPHRSEARVMQILRATVDMNLRLGTDATDTKTVRGPANPAQLNAALQGTRRLAKHDYLVILISDCYGADDDSRRLFTQICQHNDAITAFIYDPLEQQLPDAGRLVVSEGELQLEVDTASHKLQQQFQHQFDERLERVKKFSRHRAAPLLPIRTDEGVAEQIRTLLGHAGQSGRQ
ncbi:MAG: DUF58 domain-containing protein [Pirellulaceae bacterium]